jgi:hypothetical protein
VFMASATDPYQQAEALACLTQRCLTVLRSRKVEGPHCGAAPGKARGGAASCRRVMRQHHR